jgi:hypothetical protein
MFKKISVIHCGSKYGSILKIAENIQAHAHKM